MGQKNKKVFGWDEAGSKKKQKSFNSVGSVLKVLDNSIKATKIAKNLYDSFTQTEGKKKEKKGARKGYSGTGVLAGKLRKGKKLNKKVKVNGKYTMYGISKFGVTLATEHRKEVSGEEGVIIGHTSMPGKYNAMNMWRALLKHLYLKMGIHILDYGHNMVAYGFEASDRFEYSYFATSTATTVTVVNKAIDANSTFDSIAARFAEEFKNSNLVFDDRPHQLNFLKFGSGGKFQNCILDISGLKVAVYTKSMLKLQNITVENPADNEADDVTRVPLQGRLFECKGNNFIRKANNMAIPGLYNSADEHTIFQAQTRALATNYGGLEPGFYGDSAPGVSNNQTTYYKTSEMPKHWEVTNCKRTSKFYVPAGGIRTSILETIFEMSFVSYMRLLYTNYANKFDILQYNDKQGKCNAVYLEKVIGKQINDNNRIKLWTETEFRQSTLVFGSRPTYTLPITYQVDQ